MTSATAAETHRHPRTIGLLALAVVIVSFSVGSTLVRLSHTHGVTIAFWRMCLCSLIWWVILWSSEGRWLRLDDLKASLVPGVAFGANITVFFIGVTKTSIASAEFTGALTPLIVVPLGAIIFKEQLRPGALAFGGISLAGLAIVLFNAPPNGDFSWSGIAWIGVALGLWSTYLLTSRTLRQGRSVAVVMSHITPIAALVALPIGLVLFPGELATFTVRSWVFIGILAVLTGTLAHGLMVFAQKSVPIGVISMLQVAQPGMAALWSVWLLGSTIRPIQIVGMALVIVGLIAVTVQTQRTR
ncbi:MAG: DMT family transporter [Actinobacteria bacterium]|nr:DMT family transporter [Actinomycetota bacterium]